MCTTNYIVIEIDDLLMLLARDANTPNIIYLLTCLKKKSFEYIFANSCWLDVVKPIYRYVNK